MYQSELGLNLVPKFVDIVGLLVKVYMQVKVILACLKSSEISNRRITAEDEIRLHQT